MPTEYQVQGQEFKVVLVPVVQLFGRLWQEDLKFKACLHYTVRHYHKQTNRKRAVDIVQ